MQQQVTVSLSVPAVNSPVPVVPQFAPFLSSPSSRRFCVSMGGAVLPEGAIGFDGGKGLWDACRACSSRSLNRWAKQRNCEHAACARGLTRSATFVFGSLRLGNERHSVGWC